MKTLEIFVNRLKNCLLDLLFGKKEEYEPISTNPRSFPRDKEST